MQLPPILRHAPKAAAAITIVFTLVQLTVLAVWGYTPYPDCTGYEYLAREALAEGGLYPTRSQLVSAPFVWNVGAVQAVRLSIALTGGTGALLVVYALMKGATAWLVFCLTRRIADEKAALAAVAIYALYPAGWPEGTSTLSEVPFVFFNLSALCLALHRKHLAAGALMAVANWFRPMSIIFFAGLALYYFMKRSGAAAALLKTAAGAAVGVAVIGGASMAGNGRFIFQAKTGWMALAQYSWDNDSDTLRDAALFAEGNPMACPQARDAVERDAAWQRNFLTWLRHNPGEYLAQMPAKLGRTFVSDNVTFCAFLPQKRSPHKLYDELSMPRLLRDAPHFSPVQWLAVVNLAYYYALLATFAAGCFLLLRQPEGRTRLALPLGVIASGTLLLLFFGHGEARFHMPFMPFVIAVAGMVATRPRRKPAPAPQA